MIKEGDWITDMNGNLGEVLSLDANNMSIRLFDTKTSTFPIENWVRMRDDPKNEIVVGDCQVIVEIARHRHIRMTAEDEGVRSA